MNAPPFLLNPSSVSVGGKGVVNSGRAFLLDEMLYTWMENNSWAQGSKGLLCSTVVRAPLRPQESGAGLGCLHLLAAWLCPWNLSYHLIHCDLLLFPSLPHLSSIPPNKGFWLFSEGNKFQDQSPLSLETQAHGRQIFFGWRNVLKLYSGDNCSTVL